MTTQVNNCIETLETTIASNRQLLNDYKVKKNNKIPETIQK